MDQEKIAGLTKELYSTATKLFLENAEISDILKSFLEAGAIVVNIRLEIDIMPIDQSESTEPTQLETESEVENEKDDEKPIEFFEC
jgi:hypothetical protein